MLCCAPQVALHVLISKAWIADTLSLLSILGTASVVGEIFAATSCCLYCEAIGVVLILLLVIVLAV